MSQAPNPPESPEPRALPAWLRQVRWSVNLCFPLVVAAILVFAAFPTDALPEPLQGPRKQLGARMKALSLSQSWNMYAPDPAKGHYYMELYAHDADGTVRKLDDSHNAEHGWGTVWAWKRDRLDIWHLGVGRRVDKVNRNRTWYLRGVCLREARAGHEVRHVEMVRVYRRIRPPDRVAEGAELLGPFNRRKPGAGEGSCNVRIIRQMIEEDPLRERDTGGNAKNGQGE